MGYIEEEDDVEDDEETDEGDAGLFRRLRNSSLSGSDSEDNSANSAEKRRAFRTNTPGDSFSPHTSTTRRERIAAGHYGGRLASFSGYGGSDQGPSVVTGASGSKGAPNAALQAMGAPVGASAPLGRAVKLSADAAEIIEGNPHTLASTAKEQKEAERDDSVAAKTGRAQPVPMEEGHGKPAAAVGAGPPMQTPQNPRKVITRNATAPEPFLDASASIVGGKPGSHERPRRSTSLDEVNPDSVDVNVTPRWMEVCAF